MAQEKLDRISKRYFDIAEGLDWSEINAALNRLDERDPDREALQNHFINLYFDNLNLGFLRYDLKKPLVPPECIPIIEGYQKRTGSHLMAAWS